MVPSQLSSQSNAVYLSITVQATLLLWPAIVRVTSTWATPPWESTCFRFGGNGNTGPCPRSAAQRADLPRRPEVSPTFLATSQQRHTNTRANSALATRHGGHERRDGAPRAGVS